MQRSYFLIATMWAISMACVSSANTCPTDASQEEQTINLLDEHSRTLDRLHHTLKGITDKDSAEASIDLLSQLWQRCVSLEKEIMSLPVKNSTMQQHLMKNRPNIRGIFREQDRLYDNNYYQSAALRALLIAEPQMTK